jgi:hypothetical protein
MFVRPDLVSPIYNKLTPFAANNPDELFKVAKTEGWPGYVGSPRLARVDYGARLMGYRAAENNVVALAILDGILDSRQVPRYADVMLGNKTVAKELEGPSRYEAEVERSQREWMRKKAIE